MDADDSAAVLSRIDRAIQVWLVAGLSKPGKTGTALGARLGLPQSRVVEMKQGRRSIRASELPIISAYLEEPLPIEAQGFTRNTGGTVPVMGHIGAHSRVFLAHDADGADLQPTPPGMPAGTIAVIVSTPLSPSLVPGDLVFFDPEEKLTAAQADGKACIIKIQGDGLVTGQVHKSPRGPWVEDLAGNDRLDVTIEWCCPVRWVKKL